jgi:hypothetical protein
MRNLLNFIFANLVPILVVVSIVLRIIGGMRSQARKKQLSQTLQDDPAGEQEPEEEEEYTDVWSRLRPDDEEARPSPVYERVSGGVHGTGVHLPVQEIRPLLMPVPSAAPPPLLPRADPSPLSPVPPFKPETPPFESPIFEPASRSLEPEIKREGAGKNSAAAFFQRVENLSPLRRAVILAEILGPPRGLSNFPVK